MQEYPQGEFLLSLFPLPNLVFFPKTRLPLHVFEERYKALINDALSSNEQFGIVLLKPGWEVNYFGAPALFECGTMGRIEQAVTRDDGKLDILVNGLVRFRILELVSEQPYRVARVVAAPESTPQPVEAWAQRSWLADLSQRYLEFLPGGMEVPEIATASLDSLTNALVMSLNIDTPEKQRLLEIDDLLVRANEVGTILGEKLQALEFLAPYRHHSDPTLN